MNRRLRKTLQARYRQKMNSCVEKTLRGPATVGLKEELDELENYSKLLQFTQPRWTPDSSFAVIVALLCIAVAALLWSNKVPHTNISLTAVTESLHGNLTTDWNNDEPFRSQLMHFERLAKVQAPNLGLSLNEVEGDAWVKLEGGQITLQSLQVDRDALLHIEADKDQVSLFVSRKPLRGKVTIVGTGTVSAGPRSDQTSVSRHYALQVPETLEFVVSDPRAVPSRLTIHGPQKWNLGRVPLRNLGFEREEARGPAESEFSSGIKSASIRFNDTSWPNLVISENELLTIHDTADATVEIRTAEPLLHVTIDGSVKDVTAGRGGGRKRLVPSYLEYFYNRKSIGFFWGVIVFCWGILWGIRKTLFR